MKKYLLSLLLVCAGFISFCSAGVYTIEGDHSFSIGLNNNYFHFIPIPTTIFPSNNSSLSKEIYSYDCTISNFVGDNSKFNNVLVRSLGSLVSSVGFSTDALKSVASSDFLSNSYSFSGVYSAGKVYVLGIIFRVSGDSGAGSFYGTYHYSCTFSGDVVMSPGGGSSSCDPQYTSVECQSVYSLVPSSDLTSCQGDLSSCNSSLNSCNSNLSGCMTNLDNYSTSLNTCSTNLNVCNTSLSSCMSSNCPSNSGNISWSSLFVNGVQHLGAPNIRVNIPEEISWDYLSTTEDFVLDVEGYNQDSEYIESVLKVQNYTPTREDFNNTFMLFKSFSGLIVACLFVILVFYFVKKLFK